MAGRRITRSAVDWVSFMERVPPLQEQLYKAFKTKNQSFINSVHQFPEELPKIDFASYKAKLPKSAVVDEFQKAYESVKVPYPSDKDNMLKKIEEDEKAAGELSTKYAAARQEQLDDAKYLLEKIDSLPRAEEMTLDMYAYYFPQLAVDPFNKPNFWPHVPYIQPGHKECHNI